MRAPWARECADRAPEAKGQMTEWFVMEQRGQMVLLRPEFSLPQARRAWVQQVRVALAVFARACSQERLARDLAQREQVLAAFAAAAQASSQGWETTIWARAL